MSVDIFGLMGDEPPTTIQPIHHYALNLDDLENVEGFDEQGKKDGLYGFKLVEKGLYVRQEINLSEGGMDNGGIENQPITFVFSKKKWIPLPLKFNWDVDIKLSADKVSTKGNDFAILKIFNSGRILGSLVASSDNENRSVLKRNKGEYFIAASQVKTRGILSFDTKFPDEKELVKNPPSGSTMIIEGRVITGNSKFHDIIFGLEMKCETPNTDFRIIIKREEANDKVLVTPSTIETKRAEGKKILFDEISIWNDYYIKRIRLTTLPVTSDCILYL